MVFNRYWCSICFTRLPVLRETYAYVRMPRTVRRMIDYSKGVTRFQSSTCIVYKLGLSKICTVRTTVVVLR